MRSHAAAGPSNRAVAAEGGCEGMGRARLEARPTAERRREPSAQPDDARDAGAAALPGLRPLAGDPARHERWELVHACRPAVARGRDGIEPHPLHLGVGRDKLGGAHRVPDLEAEGPLLLRQVRHACGPEDEQRRALAAEDDEPARHKHHQASLGAKPACAGLQHAEPQHGDGLDGLARTHRPKHPDHRLPLGVRRRPQRHRRLLVRENKAKVVARLGAPRDFGLLPMVSHREVHAHMQ
eukprot:scaffold16880_cov126-Isochrysis_galbana.AAC.3